MRALSLISSADSASPSGPTGHRGPRAAVLLQLKERGRLTASELALALDCSLNAVRHHLKELEAEGVVVHDRAVQGVGAPAHAYRLTPQGHALFPDRYERTVADLLDHVVASQGRAAAVALLESHYEALGQRVEAATAGIPLERWGEVVARLLDAEGYMATWARAEAGGVLTEHNCPHQVVAERFPEICAAEEAFLARAFGAAVERRSQIAAGCGTCSYHVAHAGPKSEEPQ